MSAVRVLEVGPATVRLIAPAGAGRLDPGLVAAALGGIDEASRAVVPPIHVATTFVRDPDNQYRSGNIYGRPDNLTAREAEVLFWIAVVFSNSLGTAFGDFLTDNMDLSYLQGALLTSGIIAVVALLHYSRKVNDVILFWVAFVFTRPFGATFGDFLTKPIEKGGLALPREMASLVTLALMLGILATVSGHEVHRLRHSVSRLTARRTA